MQKTIQQIIYFLENKEFKKAIDLCNNTLLSVNHPQIHMFLAIAEGESGHIEKSRNLFMNLLSHFPSNPDIYFNYAAVLEKNSLFEDSIQNYQNCLRINQQHPSAWNNLGQIHLVRDETDKAISCFQKALQIDPDNIKYLKNLAYSYFQSNRDENAKILFEKFIYHESSEEEDWVTYQQVLINLQLQSQAIDAGINALKRYKNNTRLLNNTSLCYLELKEVESAYNLTSKSMEIDSEIPETSYNLAAIYAMQGNEEKLSEILSAIIKYQTPDSYIFVAGAYENNNKTSESLNTIEEGLTHFPESYELTLLKIKNLRKNKHYSEALELGKNLECIDDIEFKARLLFEKSSILDKMKEFGTAWSSVLEANKLSLSLWRRKNSRKDMYNETCERMLSGHVSEGFTFNSENTTGDQNTHKMVFILGFLRSGTTLLDSVLGARNDTTILEEYPVINQVFSRLPQMKPEHYFSQISKLDENTLKSLSNQYFQQLKNYIHFDEQSILIDKSPMNTYLAGFIHTLFPDAKIIFSVRHPLDVCISCLFQNFRVNSFMTNMTTLSDIAKTYNNTLLLWKKSQEQLGYTPYYQKYEDLISDFENQTKMLTNHLGITWQKEMADYHNRQKHRGTILNPSYSQVSQPLYQSAKYRYKNYLPYLDEAIEILKPWIEHFGYEI